MAVKKNTKVKSVDTTSTTSKVVKEEKVVVPVVPEVVPEVVEKVVDSPVSQGSEQGSQSVDGHGQVLDVLSGVLSQLRGLISVVKGLQKEHLKMQKVQAKKAQKKANGTPRPPSGFAKPSLLSDELCSFLGLPSGSSLSRTEVTSKVNQYIKEHNLQNKEDKRKIIPDQKLSKVLSMTPNDQVTYFNLQKFMKHHYTKAVSV